MVAFEKRVVILIGSVAYNAIQSYSDLKVYIHLAVFAVDAFAFIRTLYICLDALTIIFLAMRFFAMASSDMHFVCCYSCGVVIKEEESNTSAARRSDFLLIYMENIQKNVLM